LQIEALLAAFPLATFALLLPFSFPGVGHWCCQSRGLDGGRDTPEECAHKAAARGASEEIACERIEAMGAHGQPLASTFPIRA
jgi:hypothetical protein